MSAGKPTPPAPPHRRAATRRGFLAAGIAGVSAGGVARHCAAAPPPTVVADYVDPTVMQKLPFGTHSHYLQPWRGYLDTAPADNFLQGIGVVLSEGIATPESSIAEAARAGVTHARIEISWSELDYQDETHLKSEHTAGFSRLLAACRRAGVRPLIVLNANHGLPVPTLSFEGTVLANAAAGERAVRIATTKPVVPGHTGLSDQTEFWAAEILVVRTEGDRWLLAKPLPKPLHAGQSVKLATLRYEPFARLDDPRTKVTLGGWSRYVATIGGFASRALDTEHLADKGFDLEIWNELSFGTKFLSIANYYDLPPQQPQDDALWAAIVDSTAKAMAENPHFFTGVKVTNGFASTVPWPGAATQPQVVSALSKHPYPPRLSFPDDDQRNTTLLGANGRPTQWVPTYKAFFPEYAATAIQTETIVRDMGPTVTEIYGQKHGQLARPGKPVSVWLTEFGANPREAGVVDPVVAGLIKAQAITRAALFYINKGAERLYLYALTGTEDIEYGLAPPRPGRAGPAAPPTALLCLSRIADVLRDGAVPRPPRPRSLGFRVNDSPSSAVQFEGDGTGENPTLRNIDMLAILPYQSADNRFVIGIYFVTRDLRQKTLAEPVTIEVSGLRGDLVTSALYDPFADTWMTSSITRLSDATVRLTLAVTDRPCLLVLQDQQDGAVRPKPLPPH